MKNGKKPVLKKILSCFLIAYLSVFITKPSHLQASDAISHNLSSWWKNKISHQIGNNPFPSPHTIQKQAKTSSRVIVRFKQQGITKNIQKPGKEKKADVIKQLKNRNRKFKDRFLKRLSNKKFRRSRKAVDENPRSLWLANSMAITLPPDEILNLINNPDVAEVIPNMILSTQPISVESPDESQSFPVLWNHEAIGLEHLHMQGIEGSGIRIGHLDTGLDADHPEIKNKLVGWQEFDEFGNPVLSAPHETHYQAHGTHVASILVGESVGIAPGAELISALVLPRGHGTIEQVLAGMQWILDPDGDPETDDGAQVVNMSWGLPGTVTVLEEAIESMRETGVLPVVAIGNDGQGTTFSPANSPGAVAVGAVNEYDKMAGFSGGGEVHLDNLSLIKPDLSAPGTEIYGAGLSGDYLLLSGTSMATPHVAGAAALLWQYKPSLTISQLQRFLTHSTLDLGYWGLDSRYGQGRLDIKSAAEFIDSYAGRIESADLVVERHYNVNGTNQYMYLSYLSDGESQFLSDESKFLAWETVSEPSSIEPVGMGDVDGDGFKDFIVRHTEPINDETYAINWMVYPSMAGASKWFPGTGTTWYTLETDDPEAYKLIGVADADGDKRSDLVLSRVDSFRTNAEHHIFTLLSTGTGFVPPQNNWTNYQSSSFYRYHFGTGDVNGDGRADLIITRTFDEMYSNSSTLCYVGISQDDGFGSLKYWMTLRPVYPYQKIEQFFFQDVNGDGYDDMVFFQQVKSLTYLSGDIFVYACLSDGENQFLPAKKWAKIDTEYEQKVEALADVNGDKAHDLIVKYYNQQEDTNTIHVWLADKQNKVFIPSEKAWFDDSDNTLPGELKILGAANMGLGNW